MEDAPVQQRSRPTAGAVGPWIVGCTGVLITCVGEVALLTASPMPCGIDGYYYLIQTRALQVSGDLYFPTSHPLFHYIVAMATTMVGDHVLVTKCIAVALFGCAALWSGVLAWELTRSHRAASVATLLTALSSTKHYFTCEFLSNALALDLLIIGLALFWHAEHRLNRRGALAGAVVCVIAALTCHRSALVLVLVFGLAALLAPVVIRNVRRRTLSLLICAVVGAGTLGIACIRSATASNVLQAALHVYPIPTTGGSPMLVESLLVLSVAVLIVRVTRAQHGQQDAIDRRADLRLHRGFSLVLFTGALCCNPWGEYAVGVQGAMGRLALCAWPFVGPVAAWALIELRSEHHRVQSGLIGIAVVICAVMVAQPRPVAALTATYRQDREQLVKALTLFRPSLKSPSLSVVAEHGSEFAVTYITGVAASHRVLPKQDGTERRWLLRDPLRRAWPDGVIRADGFMLVPEATLQEWLHGAARQHVDSIVRANPSLLDSSLLYLSAKP